MLATDKITLDLKITSYLHLVLVFSSGILTIVMVKRGKKNTRDTPKMKSAKLSIPINDDQGEFNVSSDMAGSLL